ncbi:N-acetyltransferase [bacterium]|nr:N-acetyltransferase [bacterium]
MNKADAAANPEIVRQGAKDAGRYVARFPGGMEAELTFTMEETADGRVMIARYTGVPASLGGRGVGRALVAHMVAAAAAEGFTVRPDCSFVRAKMEDDPASRRFIARARA